MPHARIARRSVPQAGGDSVERAGVLAHRRSWQALLLLGLGVGLALGGSSVARAQNAPWVAVGEASNNTLAYSLDGKSWTGLGTGTFGYEGNGVAWNGHMWVATGWGTNSLAWSTDGKSWTGLGTGIFSGGGSGAAWNGHLWVVTGCGANSLAWSTDGKNWAPVTGTTVFSTSGNQVAWDGSTWVATGWGTNSLAWSADGKNWTGLGTDTFSSWGKGVAWDGTMWVATGEGTNSLAWSTDGKNWTGLGTSVFIAGTSVASNGTMWVATGSGANSLAWSTDGKNWTGLGKGIFDSGTSVAWSGSMWVATGEGTNTLAYSLDGKSWTGVGTGIFSECGYDVASTNAPYVGAWWNPALVATKVTMTSNMTRVAHGHPVVLSGRVSVTLPKNTKVVVWARKPGSSVWTKLSTRHTTASHRWTYTYSPAKRGTWHFRARFAGTSTRAASVSASRTIKVT